MTWAMFIMAILVSTLGRIFGEDAKTLIPRISRGLLRRAARRMNPAFGPGFYEEWVAHLEDTPELTLKLWHALSIFFWGSGRICREIGHSEESLRRYDKIKRVSDLVVVMLMSPAALFYVAVMAIAVRVTGSEPFYAADFAGKGGQIIRVYKIKTLKRIAHTNIDEYWRTDPQRRFRIGSRHYVVTRVGLFLRRTSLDKLPMLWSVLRGDLSLVGPHLAKSAQVNDDPSAKQMAVKPGISGWSQVNHAGKTESECAKLDQEYCERRSFFFDLRIIWLSMASVFLRR